MRTLLMTLLTISSLFAIGEHTNTMQADFTQTITDDKNKTITYKGHMLAKRPNLALWQYKEPIEKSVYITAHSATIVEPELEQAIVKKLDNSIDILAILASAKKESKARYIAFYDDKEYVVLMKGQKIASITYHDAFGNVVKISFSAQEINKNINDTSFDAHIPPDYDVIKD